ncbi:MAG: GAF domain-containing protein [Erysipelotrichaceae bacterium]|nr:GAF domain-containing protein [Erysipelotrichaceae bacterium]MDO5085361.1 GAF domain-containing protein [Erysipelotrichaceae bacterium]
MNSILLNQVDSLSKEEDLIAALSNVSALLNEHFTSINWIGFYFLKQDALILGPFQGKVACSKIKLTEGVCGHCATTKCSIIVDNVHEFKGHIACDSASNSELVVPILYNNEVLALIDVDSYKYANFQLEDQVLLEEVANILAKNLYQSFMRYNQL